METKEFIQEANATLSIYHDTRRKTKDGKYPVRLQISHAGKRKFYSTKINLTVDELDKTINRYKPKGQYKKNLISIKEVFDKAKQRIKELGGKFSFNKFEDVFYNTSEAKGHDVFSLTEKKIKELREAERDGSADSYQCSIKSLKNYLNYKQGKTPKTLSFEDISPKFLEGFEKYLTDVKGQSISTVGVYTRQLRAVFNDAIETGITDNYPFGRRKYKTPNARKTKKALDFDQLRQLKAATPKNKEQEKTQDFWLLSMYLYGINANDLLKLRNKDIVEGYITFYRTKTIRTSKGNLKPITKAIPSGAKQIIKKYRTPNLNPEGYVFNIISESDKATTKKQKIKNFTRFINQHIKLLAEANGLPSDLSYQWARHTYSTLYIKLGGSMEEVSEALGHSNLKITQSYFSGFENDTGIDIMEKL